METLEQRKFSRLPKNYYIQFKRLQFPMSCEPFAEARISDISAGGICVEAAKTFSQGDRLQIRIHVPRLNKFMPGFFKFYENDAEQYINAIAEVAWMENDLMGLSFVDLDQDVVRAIQGLIKDAVREARKKEELADAHKRAQEE